MAYHLCSKMPVYPGNYIERNEDDTYHCRYCGENLPDVFKVSKTFDGLPNSEAIQFAIELKREELLQLLLAKGRNPKEYDFTIHETGSGLSFDMTAEWRGNNEIIFTRNTSRND